MNLRNSLATTAICIATTAFAEMPIEAEHELVTYLRDWTTSDYCFQAGLITEDEYERTTSTARRVNLAMIEAFGWDDTRSAHRRVDGWALTLEALLSTHSDIQPHCDDLSLKYASE
ncbi:hypothetical protein [Celeribacter halophilus]|uniref:hypothetical protein n=1 Tax=Celeribacter halophilus TaxID=576117 RepID=UPI002FD0D586